MSFTYTNINSNFTFNNILSYLEQFWTTEVKVLNYNKIWLTITVTCNKKSYILINNLPFNTDNYSDIVIVLKQVFDANLYDGKTSIDSITFKLFIEKPKSKLINKLILVGLIYMALVLIILLICFIVLIIYLDVHTYLDSEILPKEILDKSLNLCSSIVQDKPISIPSNRSFILETFLQHFNKSSRSYPYFPSYFLPSKLNPVVRDFNLLEYILYRQYDILNTYSTLSKEYIEGLNALLNQYKTITNKITY